MIPLPLPILLWLRTALLSRLPRAGLVAVSLGALLSCSPQSYLAVMPGVVNNPANRTLRRELLAMGTSTLCKEVMKRSVALKLNPDDPGLGRFYPQKCAVDTLQNGDLYIQFAGMGYAWSNLTKRVGFNASAAIEYDQDFRLDGSTMYVYFRPRAITSKQFTSIMVEGGALPSTPISPILPGNSAQDFVNRVGDGLLAFELGEGFTVIRESDGTAIFSPGMLEVGQRPLEPYDRQNRDRTLIMNERVEIHEGQRDYAGPIEVPDDGSAIYVTLMVEGTSAVDIQVHPRGSGDAWLAQYVSIKDAGPPPAAPLYEEAVQSASAGPTTVPGSAGPSAFRRRIRVPRGSYYLVVDNTRTAGQSHPPAVALDDRAALVGLAVEVGSE